MFALWEAMHMSQQPPITVAMIVRNEEEFLPGCLESLQSLGDSLAEICVYDTGSTDGTVSIAQAAGARVQRGYWDDDFARARNAAAGMIQTPWALVIDADEVLQADARRLGEVLNWADRTTTTVDALAVTYDNIHADGTLTRFPSLRLYRPAHAHFNRRVHETIVAREHKDRLEISLIDPSILTMRHRGNVDPRAVTRRLQRNLLLNEGEVAAARERSSSWADREASNGGFEALKELQRCLVSRARSLSALGEGERQISDLEEARRLGPGAWRTHATELLAVALLNRGDLAGVERLILDLHEDGADRAYVDWLRAMTRRRHGDPRGGLAIFRSLGTPRTSLGETIGAAPVLREWMMCACECGEFDEAVAAWLTLASAGGELSGLDMGLRAAWGDRDLAALRRRVTAAVGPGRSDALLAALSGNT